MEHGSRDPFTKGSTQVVLRVRPLTSAEQPAAAGEEPATRLVDGAVLHRMGGLAPKYSRFESGFDKFFPGDVDAASVYEGALYPLLYRAMDGYSTCLLTTGPSGGGKSFSAMTAARYAGKTLWQLNRINGSNARISVSYIEVYQDAIYDLLAPIAGPAKGAPRPAPARSKEPEKMQGRQNFFMAGASEVFIAPTALTIVLVEGPEMLDTIIANGRANMRAKDENPDPTEPSFQTHRPSRSHTILRLMVHMQGEQERVLRGDLSIVELAGPHKQDMYRPWGGKARAEITSANRSLSLFKTCLAGVVEGGGGASFRISKLTRALENLVNGNSFLTVLVCLSPVLSEDREAELAIRLAAQLHEAGRGLHARRPQRSWVARTPLPVPPLTSQPSYAYYSPPHKISQASRHGSQDETALHVPLYSSPPKESGPQKTAVTTLAETVSLQQQLDSKSESYNNLKVKFFTLSDAFNDLKGRYRVLKSRGGGDGTQELFGAVQSGRTNGLPDQMERKGRENREREELEERHEAQREEFIAILNEQEQRIVELEAQCEAHQESTGTDVSLMELYKEKIEENHDLRARLEAVERHHGLSANGDHFDEREEEENGQAHGDQWDHGDRFDLMEIERFREEALELGHRLS